MIDLLGALALLAGGGMILYVVNRRLRFNRLAEERLEAFEIAEQGWARPAVARYSLLRRNRLLPWLAALVAAITVYFILGWPLVFVASVSVIVVLLGSQLEALWSVRKAARIEVQLADTIDLMIGALGAGAGVMVALESAVRESREPLRTPLEEMIGRIRLGDDPKTVFHGLYQRVPLETFLLFSSALAVQWETGGSLAPTLATVGRTIRDRVEMSRRIHSNTVQSQLSTAAVLGVTYFLALVIWRSNPDQMRQFLATSFGQLAVAGTMLLEGLGIAWMSTISRMRF